MSFLAPDAPDEHEELLLIHTFTFGDLSFEVYEGSGGHLYGEMIYVCREPRLAFTGDVYLNVKGIFGSALRTFWRWAPYMMTSVDVDPKRARRTRSQVTQLLQALGPGTLIGTGHGAVEMQSSLQK